MKFKELSWSSGTPKKPTIAQYTTKLTDIATLHKIHSTNLLTIEKIFKYVINSSPGELNTNKLSSHLGKDFETVDNFLKYLNEAGLIRFLYSEKSGKAFLRKPTKIYPENTNLIYANYLLPQNKDDTLGKIRETFVVNNLQNTNHQIFYSENGDFKVSSKQESMDYYFEVGRKNKKLTQFKDKNNAFIVADNILTGTKNTIPLYLFGFLS